MVPIRAGAPKAQLVAPIRDVGASVREADALLDSMMKTEDYREAVSAYSEKRPTRWTGK